MWLYETRNGRNMQYYYKDPLTAAYMKLLFPHWLQIPDVNLDEFDRYCLQPAIRGRGIIKEQCHNIDVEFKTKMPEIRLKNK